MIRLGIDLGASTIKLVQMGDDVQKLWCARHHGEIGKTFFKGLTELGLPEEFSLCITGSHRMLFLTAAGDVEQMEDIPAIVEGTKYLCPKAGSIIEIGSQSARFITELSGKSPRFSVNEHCAGGTGSFFEDQMSRLELPIEDYSRLVEKARDIPNLSGRCAVFAKTDIIHRQQEGYPKEDILLGLCYAMTRNYKATIVKDLPVEKPVVFCGGVTRNAGVIRAIRDVFSLSEEELLVPEQAVYSAAIGAALQKGTVVKRDELLERLFTAGEQTEGGGALPRLRLFAGTDLSEPEKSEVMPASGAYLGIDVGSTSTDLVLAGKDGALIDFLYLRTAGDPEGVVRRGFAQFKEKYGAFPILGVGITGSGRERLGNMMEADAIRDEITAQAKAAAWWVPEVDTVFEIGGQDSKFISLKDGNVVDFQMNKICAAGTGSFVEEQAARMGIPISQFGSLALQGEHPCDLGERCTVFIETAITQAAAQGAGQADIAAGLCHSIVKNYLHKVVGSKRVGEHIVLQGGVDYNPGIVAAFQSAYGNRVRVSPVFSISGAFGAALLAQEAVGSGESTFLGFDFPREEKKVITASEEIRRNKAFYKKAGQLVIEDYDSTVDPHKKTIGVPLTLIMFKFFPMVNAFFKNLGFNVVLSKPSNEETIRLSQQYAQGETCYPVKLIYGHMMQLAKEKVDYIFLPSVRTIRHPHSHAAHNYACPYMQKAAQMVFASLGLEQKGIRLLSPVLDLDLGAQMMGMAMLETGKSLGFSKARCLPGLAKGALAVNKFTQDMEALGREMLSGLKPEEKVLVLITRNYGISDPVLNMGIPEILLSKGYKVMTLGHLPGMSLDISADYPNMYWPFGDHLLSGAKLIANHPNLYAVYLTNHGCGPDTLISHMFREEMGEKPYLQIEVDEHYSPVGVITRIEAFLNSIQNHKNDPVPEDFNILDVTIRPANIQRKPEKGKKLLIPPLGYYTRYLADYFRRQGFHAEAMPGFTHQVLNLGRAEMVSKEYLPLPMLVGSCLQAIAENGGDEGLQFLIPYGYGADADSQYARAVRTILDRKSYTKCGIVSPMLEELPETAEDLPLLIRALLTGDVVYALPYDRRQELAPRQIPALADLMELAKQAGGREKRTIAAVGSPMCITSLDEGVLSMLEQEGNRIKRQPLSEMMAFLWQDNGKTVGWSEISRVAQTLGAFGSFAPEPDILRKLADRYLPSFAGNHGRYRFAKALQIGESVDAVLTMAPRYENTATVLSLCGLEKHCVAPVFALALDGDWDENSTSRLRSFLYYC